MREAEMGVNFNLQEQTLAACPHPAACPHKFDFGLFRNTEQSEVLLGQVFGWEWQTDSLSVCEHVQDCTG